MILDQLLDEQREFYELRAPEWRDWVERYMGPVASELESLLNDTRALHGTDVLEIAAGTGYLTQWLAQIAARVTALDASPAMLSELNRLDLPNVTTICRDVFEWFPTRRYDAILCANWLSHVPRHLWADHWTTLDDALAPGGVIVAIDATVDEIPYLGHPWWHSRLEDGHREALTTRALNNGQRFRVVKRFWEPKDLMAEVTPLGWAGEHIRVSEDRGIILYRFWRAV
jgi:trans-aconitate methyltransferase